MPVYWPHEAVDLDDGPAGRADSLFEYGHVLDNKSHAEKTSQDRSLAGETIQSHVTNSRYWVSPASYLSSD